MLLSLEDHITNIDQQTEGETGLFPHSQLNLGHCAATGTQECGRAGYVGNQLPL